MNKIHIPQIIVNNYRKDKHGHIFCIATCPYCCNFFVVRKDRLMSGNKKSCGCLSHKRKRNIYYFPLGCNYTIGYYDNCDAFFIFDRDKFETVSKYYWTCRDKRKRIEPITTINGKTTSMARLLMNTPADLECDHINRNTSDNRLVNLRNCSHSENLENRKIAQNNISHSSIFSFGASQKIAESIETHRFNNPLYLGGILNTVNKLPEKNIFKIILRNIVTNVTKGNLSEDDETRLLLQLIHDFKLHNKKPLDF